MWVKIKPPGYGPQVLVHASISQDSILGTSEKAHNQISSGCFGFQGGVSEGSGLSGAVGIAPGHLV